MTPLQPTAVKMASYGTWNSPITAEKVAEGTTSILNLLIDGTSTYWNELRPSNKGRYTLVQRNSLGELKDLTPPDFNVRTLVHEYGGGAFTVKESIVYASEASTSKIYVVKAGEAPKPLTEGQTILNVQGKEHIKGTRFADLLATKKGIIAIGERHEPEEVVENFLALIDTSTGKYKKLASGHDFYSSPAISCDEKKIAWICWNHPHMPWTHTELWSADFTEEGDLKNLKQIAGDIPEALFQPGWSPEGVLYFVSDRDRGWWNLHRFVNGSIENICPIEAEVAEPLWVFGRSTWGFFNTDILFTYNQNGVWSLGIINLETKKWKKIEQKGIYLQQLRTGEGFARFLEGYPDRSEAVIQLDDKPGYPMTCLYTDEHGKIDEGYISAPTHIQYKSGNRVCYAFFYPPKNKDFTAPQGEKPPLIVMIHGGPTAQSKGAFSLSRQYWTSRGFAVLDVNYGGSTGYGRDYRMALDHMWGIVDVEDCVNGALYIEEKGLVDKEKVVIRGGSAGGYTTLAALAFTNVFKAGASYYGVADITALAKETHKFESRYMEQLVGKYPEEKSIWEERSPINSVNTINSPLILFQGENDRIVPKDQSEMIFQALKKRGIQTELTIYPGEEHGFRQAKNIIDSLEKEKNFYLKVFNKG